MKELHVGILFGLVGASALGVIGRIIYYYIRSQEYKLLYKPDPTLPFNFSRSVRDGFCGSIGDSPMIYLRSISEETGCHIFVCFEFVLMFFFLIFF